MGPPPDPTSTGRTAIDLRGQVRQLNLNLGCGMSGIPGWVNIDGDPLIKFRFVLKALKPLLRRRLLPFSPELSDLYLLNPLPPSFLFWDLGRGHLPFEDGSAAAIFTSHTLEHFPRFVARRIVADVRRVMRDNAVFRIVVPDLETLVRRYLLALDPERAITPGTREVPIVARDVNRAFYQGRTRYHIERESPWDAIDFEGIYARVFKTRGHMYLYDFSDLSSMLREVGFSRVERRRFQEGDCPDLMKLDNRPDESLYVEAYR